MVSYKPEEQLLLIYLFLSIFNLALVAAFGYAVYDFKKFESDFDRCITDKKILKYSKKYLKDTLIACLVLFSLLAALFGFLFVKGQFFDKKKRAVLSFN